MVMKDISSKTMTLLIVNINWIQFITCAVVTDSNKSNSENNRKKCQGIHNSVCMILFHRIVPTIDRAQEIEFDEKFVVHADHNKVPERKQLYNTLSYSLIIH